MTVTGVEAITADGFLRERRNQSICVQQPELDMYKETLPCVILSLNQEGQTSGPTIWTGLTMIAAFPSGV